MEDVYLSEEQRRQFDEEGYLIVRHTLDADTIERLIDAGDRLMASDLTENRQPKSKGADGFRNCIALDDAYLPLITQATVFPLVADIFGPGLHLTTSNVIHRFADPKGTPRTYRCPGWHRDIANTPRDLGHANIPRLELKVAYYLTDHQEPDSGVTLVAPGSNLLKDSIRIPEGQVDPENTLEAKLRPGDALIFENRTWHAGGLNLSGRTRKCVMMGYSYKWMAPMDYRIQPAHVIEKLSGDPIATQLIGEAKDPEGRFVPGGVETPMKEFLAARKKRRELAIV